MTSTIHPLDMDRADLLIRLALEEDLDGAGDITTNSVIPEDLHAKAVLLAKDELVCAGMPIAQRLFQTISDQIEFTPVIAEGDLCRAGTVMATLHGPARALLTGERTALNFLQRLCGVATASRRYQDQTAGKAVILDTRKTTPGWRNLEKYAVSVGGAQNHRIGLFDRVMIKDNHRELAGLEGEGGILRSVSRARAMYPQFEVEVEVDSLDELSEALLSRCEYILLDNMSLDDMHKAVRMTHEFALENQIGAPKLEASGNVTIARVEAIAACGVDFISSGALTHSVKSADISLDILLE